MLKGIQDGYESEYLNDNKQYISGFMSTRDYDGWSLRDSLEKFCEYIARKRKELDDE